MRLRLPRWLRRRRLCRPCALDVHRHNATTLACVNVPCPCDAEPPPPPLDPSIRTVQPRGELL